MKRTIPNRKLTANFWLWEFIEGALMPSLAKRMNWKNIAEFYKYDVQKMAEDAQCIRVQVNEQFQKKNNGKDIGVLITSGWRCLEWELHKNRSGKSRHTTDAFDWRPSNVSPELNDEILVWANKRWGSRTGGWNGGFAIADPNRTDPNPAKHLWGFAHHDRRGYIARWSY